MGGQTILVDSLRPDPTTDQTQGARERHPEAGIMSKPKGDRVPMIPYEKLYIYEIDGEIRADDKTFPPEYIGTWWEGGHSFIFFSHEHEQLIQSLLTGDPSLHLVDRFAMDYRDWQAGEEIVPFRVGRIVFVPPWEKAETSPDETVIFLDPSVVFGTGLHPTTRSCLEALRRLYQEDCPRTVIDLGTGTGILALACAKLGAERILAIDHNPLAVKTATRNVSLNGENNRIRVIRGSAEDLISEDADLVCCNLHYQVLDRLLSVESFFEKRWSVLSGFFEREQHGLVQRLLERGVHVRVIPCRGPWQTLMGLHPSYSVHASALTS